MINKITAALVLSVGLYVVACSNHKQNDGETPKPVVAVGLQSVSKGSITLEETISGRTDVEQRNTIVAPIAGKIIILKGMPGTKVHIGDIIAVIRTKESDAAISGAQTFVSQARTTEQKAEAQRMLELATNTQSATTLRSPINGVIVSQSSHVGDMVAENAEIMMIVDISTFIFVADAPTTSLETFHPGQHGTVHFDAFPDSTYPVIVQNVGAESDSQSQHIKVRLKFSAAHNRLSSLKTDMTGIAHIVTGIHANTLLVPRSALLRNDETNSYSVVTITPDSLSKTVQVIIGISNDSLTEIVGGALHDGMTIITQGNYALSDSIRITAAREKP